MLKSIALLVITLAFTFTLATTKHCNNPFTNANVGHYNLIVFGDCTSCESDTEGRVCCGGDASFKSYSIGAGLSERDEDAPYCLTSPQTIEWKGGSCLQGAISGCPATDISNVVIVDDGYFFSNTCCKNNDCSSCNSEATYTSPVNYAEVEKCATSTSSHLSSLATTDCASIEHPSANELTLVCCEDESTNVFNIDTDLITSITIQCSASQTVLINYPSNIVEVSNIGFKLDNGVTADRIIHHVGPNNANSLLHIKAVGLPGSLFAPSRHLYFEEGLITGQVIVNKFTAPDTFFTPAAADADSCGSNGGHAVWLPGISTKLLFESSSDPAFVENPSDKTATITGVVSQGNIAFEVEVHLSGYHAPGDAPSGSPKKELKSNCYTPNGPVDPNQWRYYTNIVGKLTATSGSEYDGTVLSLTRMGPSAQVGVGANGKNVENGLSFWFNYVVEKSGPNPTNGNGRGDFNLNLYGSSSTDDAECPRGQINHLPFSGCLSVPSC